MMKKRFKNRVEYLLTVEHYGARRSRCVDCKGINQGYMLNFELWALLVKPRERHKLICLQCIEKRLGRPLILNDFLGFSIGEPIPPINLGCFDFDARLYTSLKP